MVGKSIKWNNYGFGDKVGIVTESHEITPSEENPSPYTHVFKVVFPDKPSEPVVLISHMDEKANHYEVLGT